VSREALALIDVDGVLNPHGSAACPPGYIEHELFPGELVRVRPEHGAMLLRLAERYTLVWATYWEDEANRLLAPLLGLPRLPVIPCAGPPGGGQDKLLGIAPWVADRPVVWFDDLHSAAAWEWAERRDAPTRLIHVDPVSGLTDVHIDQALGL
jgi:hypothetical protein